MTRESLGAYRRLCVEYGEATHRLSRAKWDARDMVATPEMRETAKADIGAFTADVGAILKRIETAEEETLAGRPVPMRLQHDERPVWAKVFDAALPVFRFDAAEAAGHADDAIRAMRERA